MYDEDPALFLAGASGFGAAGAGGLAFTGAETVLIAVVGITAIVVGLLLMRLAVRTRDGARAFLDPAPHPASAIEV